MQPVPGTELKIRTPGAATSTRLTPKFENEALLSFPSSEAATDILLGVSKFAGYMFTLSLFELELPAAEAITTPLL